MQRRHALNSDCRGWGGPESTQWRGPGGAGDQLGAPLAGDGVCWAYLSLYRDDGRAWFSPGDAAFVASVAPLLAARPAPNPQQWQYIKTALAPIFTAAGFHPNYPVGQTPPPGNESQIRDDGALTNLTNPPDLGVLSYSYTTGCHLPAAWRTGPPPPSLRGNDPNAHYPYLYGSPGGRADAFGDSSA